MLNVVESMCYIMYPVTGRGGVVVYPTAYLIDKETLPSCPIKCIENIFFFIIDLLSFKDEIYHVTSVEFIGISELS